MANKTIHELTELTQGNVGTSQELAIYDVSDNSTKRVTVGNLFGIDEFLTADDDDEPTGQVDFTSEDELNPTDTEDVDLLTGNDSWSQRFHKVSQMFKNIRYILGKLGTTDISSIGNGTVTGAISNLNNKIKITSFTGTTSAGGNISYTFSKKVWVLAAWNTTSDNLVFAYPSSASPGQDGSTSWWFHVMFANANHAAVVSVQRTFRVVYVEV